MTSTADSGPGSLRDAIASSAPGDLIDFAVSGPITLTTDQLVIDKDLTIAGPGSGLLTIQRDTAPGTPEFRVFYFLAGNMTLSGVTIRNGRSDYGGGILNEAGAVGLIQDVVLDGNAATVAGGGLYNFGSLAIEDGGFINNTAVALDDFGAYGGALANLSTIAWIERCRFEGNSAGGGTGAGGGFGGAIENDGTIGSLADCVFEGNAAAGGPGSGSAFGGAINNNFGTMSLSACAVRNNTATGGSGGAAGYGGGINNEYGTTYLQMITVSGNIAAGGAGDTGGLAEGGGVANGFGTVELDRSTVSGNAAIGGDGAAGGAAGSGEGGGVANDYATVYLTSSTVSGNIAAPGAGGSPGLPCGGGMMNGFGSLILSCSTIASNSVTAGPAEDGGGVFNLVGSVEVTGTIIAANSGAVDLYTDDFGYIISDGFNLVGSTSGPVSAGPGDQFNTTAAALKLGPLQDNGGPTFTHALLCGSPAVNAGNNAGAPATDQRGFARIVAGTIDIGAFESTNTPPAVTCPDPVTLTCAPPSGSSATLSATVTDADGDPLTVVWSVDGTDYQTNNIAGGGPPTSATVPFTALFGIGSHQVVVSVSDSSQCTVSCSVSVDVSGGGGGQPLTVQCPAAQGVSTGAGCLAALPNLLGSATASGGCGTVTLSESPAAGTMVGPGTWTITVTATDAAGNTAHCASTVTVSDTAPPTVSCPAPSSASANANCQAPVPNVLAGVTVSDNCTPAGSIALSQSPAAGTLVGPGTWTITVTATDAAGNSAGCTTSFTVRDTTPPAVVCPAPSSASANANCQAPVPNVLAGVTVSDNCTPAGSIALSQSPAAGTLVGPGTWTITVTATDAAGNSAGCATSFTVSSGASPVAGSCSLGLAGPYTVFIMGNLSATKSAISESGTRITGDVAVGPSASGSSSDLLKATIDGKLFVDPAAVVDIHPDLVVTGGTYSQGLAAARNDALAASACYAALAPTRTYGAIQNSITITGNGGLNVIQVGSVVLVKGVITLSGGPNDIFIFNVSGDYSLGSAQIKLTGGVKAGNVLWNFPGTGTAINVYKSVTVAVGTFLAPYRDYIQDVATLNGCVYAGGNVRIHSGAIVTRPAGCSN